jgi:transposase-like protein
VKILREGIGFRGIGKLLNINFETVRRWAKTFNFKIEEDTAEVKIDEMCITYQKKSL